MMLVAACLALALSASWARAGTADAPPEQAAAPSASAPDDPFEHLNRRFYGDSQRFDRKVLRPAAMAYERRTPRPIRLGLRNFIRNLSEPVVFANDVLQLRFKRAARTAVRFAANSTVGVGGLFDPATHMGLEHHDNGFGITLGRYRVKSGPYLYLPVAGPSTVRDLIGTGVDLAMDPFHYLRYPGAIGVSASTTVVHGLDERAQADGDLHRIDDMGTDGYATMRSLYLQNRQAEIKGDQVKVEDLPSFDDGASTSASPAPAPDRLAPGQSAGALATQQPITPPSALPQPPSPDQAPAGLTASASLSATTANP